MRKPLSHKFRTVQNFPVLIGTAISLRATMPRDPKKKAVEVALTPDEFALFSGEAKDRDWSNKKLAEKIIKYWMGQKGLLPAIEMP